MSFEITREPIEVARYETRDSRIGAVVTFEGRVRDNNEGREVKALEYTCHEVLALKEGGRILEEALKRFPILSVQAVHRVGPLGLNDIAVYLRVTAGHRGEAFEACRWLIDEIKARVPIWKREDYGVERTWL